jgi:hypothetical protein
MRECRTAKDPDRADYERLRPGGEAVDGVVMRAQLQTRSGFRQSQVGGDSGVEAVPTPWVARL